MKKKRKSKKHEFTLEQWATKMAANRRYRIKNPNQHKNLTPEQRTRKYAANARYYAKNKEYMDAKAKERRKKPEVREHINAMDRERRKVPHNRIAKNLRKRVWDALQGNAKSDTTERLLGCTIKELMQHLEERFVAGMTWDNYGEWHVDHIRPCASFDLAASAQQEICFHYTNLQPLWTADNIRKKDRCTLSTRIAP